MRDIAAHYGEAGVRLPADLVECHRFLLDHIRSPGTWWSGEERLALAAEGRAASGCGLCRDRKAALSPGAVSGRHDSTGFFEESVVDAVHRIRTDSGRLSKAWFERVCSGGLDEGRYVELVSVVSLLAGLDFFARALGVPPLALPAALPGEPTRRWPESARRGTAWVPVIAPEDARGPEADLYGAAPFVPNIIRALSLVPDEARALQRSSNAHYLPVAQIEDPSARRALDRMQMELVASRVSALNQCFY